ncbi:TetR/AcrR family transcriptional regulator [Micromonospora sp. CPCC 206060]|uniref:TetR/AcrR family transcriptional regulator n=1 Tax=Micromonospora sp. CPCC 206060 TaxID=3122406 RepID=UPI002FF097FB
MVASPARRTALTPLPGARTGRDPARAIKRGPRQLPAEVVRATQRDRLFDALVHTVATKGYANARVSDICQAAGVTRPAFYALFAGKDDAFLATYRHGTDVLLKLMEQAYSDAGDWPAGCRAALRVLLDVLASVPAFAMMAIVEIDAVGPAARYERDLLLRRFDQFFRDAPPGPGPVGPTGLTGAVVGGINSMVYRYVAAGRVAELPDLLPTLAYFMVAPFLGPQEAARVAGEHPADEPVRPPCAPANAVDPPVDDPEQSGM